MIFLLVLLSGGFLSLLYIILHIFWIESFLEIREASLETNENSSKNIDFLVSVVIEGKKFSGYAVKCLSRFKSNKYIDLFCNKWVNNRAISLTNILIEAGYVATQPDKLKVLTALKVNKFRDCLHQNYYLVKELLEAFEDQDIEIASCAKKSAVNLSSQEAIDYLFYLFFEENNQIAYQVIKQANYQSTQANYKALFHILRSEWEAYEALDFDQVLLQGIYQSASSELRNEIADKARQQGWTEWLTVASQKGKNLENMTHEEWDVNLSILKNNRDYGEMWRLVNQAPVWVCHELLVELSRCSWRPSQGHQETFERLLALSNQCVQINIRDISNFGKCLFSAEGYYREISPNWQFLITSDDEIKVWRIADGKCLFSVNEYYKGISPDGQFLITSNAYNNNENPKTHIPQLRAEKKDSSFVLLFSPQVYC